MVRAGRAHCAAASAGRPGRPRCPGRRGGLPCHAPGARRSTDSLVSKGSDAYEATQHYNREFGDEAAVVLVKGKVDRLVLTQNRDRIAGLEVCLGAPPPQEGAPLAIAARKPAACQELAKLKPFKTVVGPGTFVLTAIAGAEQFLAQRAQQAQQQAESNRKLAEKISKRRGDSPAEQKRLGEIAAKQTVSEFERDLVGLAVRYNILSRPQSPEFISALVFDLRCSRRARPRRASPTSSRHATRR